MLSIFKKKSTIPPDFSSLYCDMHSHLVPGIDDGSPDLETSIQLIRGFADLGYKKIITTPHILWDMYKNTPEIILQGMERVKTQLAKENISMIFSAAAEYYMDDYFDKLLESNIPLLKLKDNLVLVEFSFIREPVELKKTLFNLQIKGYQPVIAHPERYLYFNANKKWYDEMKNAGCLFQLNILSLTGFYGKAPFQLSQYLIGKKYINLLGTDLHNPGHLDMLKSMPAPAMDAINKLVDSGMIKNSEL